MPERPPFVDLERLDAGVTGTDATPDELDMVGLDPERGGVKLTAVVPGLAGDRAGLEAGDLVLAIDGRSLTREERGMRALGEVVRNADRGQAVELTVQKASGRLVLARLELR
jgi:S1-C subfamily serine protease